MRLNKYEAKELRARRMEQAFKGSGLYLYENNSDGDLILPRPTASGLRAVPARRQFQGDSYYMQMVKTNQLKLVKELMSPQDQKKRALMAEQKLNEEKLLLDQPETFTNEGQVEYVNQAELPPMNEVVPPITEGQDVLLNEAPLDGLEIDLE